MTSTGGQKGHVPPINGGGANWNSGGICNFFALPVLIACSTPDTAGLFVCSAKCLQVTAEGERWTSAPPITAHKTGPPPSAPALQIQGPTDRSALSLVFYSAVLTTTYIDQQTVGTSVGGGEGAKSRPRFRRMNPASNALSSLSLTPSFALHFYTF